MVELVLSLYCILRSGLSEYYNIMIVEGDKWINKRKDHTSKRFNFVWAYSV